MIKNNLFLKSLITKNKYGETISIEYDCYTGCVVGNKTSIIKGNDVSGSLYTTTILQCCTTSYCNVYIDTSGNGNGNGKGNENDKQNGSAKKEKSYLEYFLLASFFYQALIW